MKKQYSQSFTLIEMLIAVFLFTITVALVFLGFFATSSYQAKSSAMRNVTQASRDIIETITRDIRWADSADLVSSTSVHVKKGSVDTTYCFSNNQILISNTSNCNSTLYNFASMIQDVEVSDFFVNTSNTPTNQNFHITVSVKEKGNTKEAEKSVITLWTSVTRRNFNLP